ncbi:hypothetical protein [Kamptonema formosum]|uniref:hypothetical protein n=1 Tax=Kamptonema formosum TaxID=331992 RepID=UPI0012DDB933|nr:hypothetical protein [Oscillatoria sp. PCC 10802]
MTFVKDNLRGCGKGICAHRHPESETVQQRYPPRKKSWPRGAGGGVPPAAEPARPWATAASELTGTVAVRCADRPRCPIDYPNAVAVNRVTL